MKEKENYTKSCLLGLAIGDALGVPYEFMNREDVRKIFVKNMLGVDNADMSSYWGDRVPSGSWSDDTSMTIAVMDAFIKDEGNPKSKTIMDNFINWWYKGEYCSIDHPFGLGVIISKSLDKYRITKDADNCGYDGYRDNGNGSLMRILPHSLYVIYHNLNHDEMVKYINNASSLTHAHEISKMACLIYTLFLLGCYINNDKNSGYSMIRTFNYENYYSKETINNFNLILSGELLEYDDLEAKKNGYVVATLEEVLFSIMKNDNFEDTLIMAVKFGYDTDTVAAIAGSIAGMLYGYNSIPEYWLKSIKRREYLINLANKFDFIISNNIIEKYCLYHIPMSCAILNIYRNMDCISCREELLPSRGYYKRDEYNGVVSFNKINNYYVSERLNEIDRKYMYDVYTNEFDGINKREDTRKRLLNQLLYNDYILCYNVDDGRLIIIDKLYDELIDDLIYPVGSIEKEKINSIWKEFKLII